MGSRKQPPKAPRRPAKGLGTALTQANGKHVAPVKQVAAPADPLARLEALREQLLDTVFGVGRDTRERIVRRLLDIAETTESEGVAVNAGFALGEFDRNGLAAAKIVVDGLTAAAAAASRPAQASRVQQTDVVELVAELLGPPEQDEPVEQEDQDDTLDIREARR